MYLFIDFVFIDLKFQPYSKNQKFKVIFWRIIYYYFTGRVADGTCYRLIPEEFWKSLKEFPDPAINRQPLEKIVLDVKRLNRGLSERDSRIRTHPTSPGRH